MASAIEDIIEEIEEYIDSCKPAAFSSTKIVVNRDDIQSLIEELRTKTPEEIRRYQKMINNKEAILADARKKADTIIAQAEIQTNELVSEHQIMQQAYEQANEVVNIATKRAQELLDRATNEANEIRTGAILYTDDLLKNIQDVMVRSLDMTKQTNDKFLTRMQEYLDTVVANRMELSPSPEDTAANAPSVAENTQSAIDELKHQQAEKRLEEARAEADAAEEEKKRRLVREAELRQQAREQQAQDQAQQEEVREHTPDEGVKNMAEEFFNNED